MADNTPFVASTDPAAPKIADDEVTYSGDPNAKVQIIQLATVQGAEGSRTLTKMTDFSAAIGTPGDAAATTDGGTFSLIALFKRFLGTKLPAGLGATTAANSFPVTLSTDGQFVVATGATNETAPATDIASSGLNGRLQRIAQRLTSLIALVPASLGAKAAASSFAVVLATEQEAEIGATGETAPASDTASSGLNGRLQRIAQRLTSLIALLPTSLTAQGGALRVGSSEVVLTASVASGQTLQGTGSDLGGLRNWGVVIPSTFDGTQIQFQISDTLGGTYVPVYSWDNQRVIMTVAASRFYDIPGELMGIRFLKIECLTAQATSATDFLIIGKS